MDPAPGAALAAPSTRIVTWNLFHGRDRPPDKGLYGWRGRLCRLDLEGDRYVQVNRPLLAEFGEVLGREPWEILLLQEAPPRWHAPLCTALGAHGAIALTSRNGLGFLRSWIADRNPDLIGSLEGGSNQILARAPWSATAVRRTVLTRLPERRVMVAVRLEHPDGRALWVTNLHASFHSPAPAAREVDRAAEAAVSWANGEPLVFGGDLNLRPRTSGEVFDALRERHGLAGPTNDRAIDHLLVAGIPQAEPAQQLPPEWRELPDPRTGRLLRLSDHPAVTRDIVVP